MTGSYALERFPPARVEQAAHEAHRNECRGTLFRLGDGCRRIFDSTICSIRSKLPMYWTPKPIRNIIRDIKEELDAQKAPRPLPVPSKFMLGTQPNIACANTASTHHPVMEPLLDDIVRCPHHLTTSNNLSVLNSCSAPPFDYPNNITVDSSPNWAAVNKTTVSSTESLRHIFEHGTGPMDGSEGGAASALSMQRILPAQPSIFTNTITSATSRPTSETTVIVNQNLQDHVQWYKLFADHSDAHLNLLDEALEHSFRQWAAQINVTRNVLHTDTTAFISLIECELPPGVEYRSPCAGSDHSAGVVSSTVDSIPMEVSPIIALHEPLSKISPVSLAKSLSRESTMRQSFRSRMSIPFRGELHIPKARKKTTTTTASTHAAATEQSPFNKVLRHIRQRIPDRTGNRAAANKEAEHEDVLHQNMDHEPTQSHLALRRVKARITNSLRLKLAS